MRVSYLNYSKVKLHNIILSTLTAKGTLSFVSKKKPFANTQFQIIV